MKFIKLFFLLLPVFFLISCGNPTEEPVYPKATHLYFTDYSGKKIGVMDVNVPNAYDVIADESDGLDTLAGLAIDFTNDKIYVVEELNNRVLRLNLDGSGTPEVLYDETGTDSVSTPTAVAVDPLTNSLYWANSGTGQLKKASLDGTAVPLSMYGYREYINYCYGLVVSKRNNVLLFSDLGDDAAIWNAKLDGTGVRGYIFAPNNLSLQNPSGLFVDDAVNLVYWADEGLGKIVGGSLSSGGTVVLFDREDGITRPDGIAVDRGNGKIYWTETDKTTDTYRIVRANLDGTGTPETILDGVESYSIVLKFEDQ